MKAAAEGVPSAVGKVKFSRSAHDAALTFSSYSACLLPSPSNAKELALLFTSHHTLDVRAPEGNTAAAEGSAAFADNESSGTGPPALSP